MRIPTPRANDPALAAGSPIVDGSYHANAADDCCEIIHKAFKNFDLKQFPKILPISYPPDDCPFRVQFLPKAQAVALPGFARAADCTDSRGGLPNFVATLSGRCARVGQSPAQIPREKWGFWEIYEESVGRGRLRNPLEPPPARLCPENRCRAGRSPRSRESWPISRLAFAPHARYFQVRRARHFALS